MDIVKVCFEKNINSVIMQVPDLEELYEFKKCIRKYARVKMRAINYYNYSLNKDKEFFVENANLFKHFLNKTSK